VLLFTITEAFMITGRGVVLMPGLGENAQYVKPGSKIRLVRPDKSEMQTTIQGITFNDQHDILLAPEVTKADVPIGTEVWLEE
jgi:hypothetical protein